ncbi:MAG: DUF4158 domain-containing protein [Chloroflexi bacterium]|nr:DUF4158 domain-containing protein [Chloroflexota bacterium]
MPIGFLTDADRDRLNRFPTDVAPADLLTYFTLSETDLELVQTHRGDHNRLGCALQLVAVKFLGFSPDSLSTAPTRAVAYLALQLGVPAAALGQYGDREHARTDHLHEIQAYLGFRDALPDDFDALRAWLAERALEHDRTLALLHVGCEWLRQEKIVRPGVTRLERVVARARELAQAETFGRLAPLLRQDMRDKLDAVLVPDPSTGRTRVARVLRGCSVRLQLSRRTPSSARSASCPRCVRSALMDGILTR